MQKIFDAILEQHLREWKDTEKHQEQNNCKALTLTPEKLKAL